MAVRAKLSDIFSITRWWRDFGRDLRTLDKPKVWGWTGLAGYAAAGRSQPLRKTIANNVAKIFSYDEDLAIKDKDKNLDIFSALASKNLIGWVVSLIKAPEFFFKKGPALLRMFTATLIDKMLGICVGDKNASLAAAYGAPGFNKLGNIKWFHPFTWLSFIGILLTGIVYVAATLLEVSRIPQLLGSAASLITTPIHLFIKRATDPIMVPFFDKVIAPISNFLKDNVFAPPTTFIAKNILLPTAKFLAPLLGALSLIDKSIDRMSSGDKSLDKSAEAQGPEKPSQASTVVETDQTTTPAAEAPASQTAQSAAPPLKRVDSLSEKVADQSRTSSAAPASAAPTMAGAKAEQFAKPATVETANDKPGPSTPTQSSQ